MNDVKQGDFVELRPAESVRLAGKYDKGNRNGKFIYTNLQSGEFVKEEQWE